MAAYVWHDCTPCQPIRQPTNQGPSWHGTPAQHGMAHQLPPVALTLLLYGTATMALLHLVHDTAALALLHTLHVTAALTAIVMSCVQKPHCVCVIAQVSLQLKPSSQHVLSGSVFLVRTCGVVVFTRKHPYHARVAQPLHDAFLNYFLPCRQLCSCITGFQGFHCAKPLLCLQSCR